MRDFRDAKTMAQTLRDALATKSVTISHSESLELVAKMLGVSDWNALSALLQADRRETGTPAAKRLGGAVSYPAIPLRDLVPFPTISYPLLVGRDKTKQALDQAFERQREVVMAVQREPAVDDPRFDDVHEVGVLARLLELKRFDERTLMVQAQAHRRVVIRRFTEETGAFQAEVADIREGPIPDAPFLIHRAAARFKNYVAAHEIQVGPASPLPLDKTHFLRWADDTMAAYMVKARQTWSPLDRIRDPGRVADMIAAYVVLPITEKQSLLATLDPVARLEKVYALMDAKAETADL